MRCPDFPDVSGGSVTSNAARYSTMDRTKSRPAVGVRSNFVAVRKVRV